MSFVFIRPKIWTSFFANLINIKYAEIGSKRVFGANFLFVVFFFGQIYVKSNGGLVPVVGY